MTLLPTIKSKVEQLARLVFVNTITHFNDSIILVEYPKSGGTWLSQMISDYLDIPFPRHRIPSLSKSVYHSHYLPIYKIPKNKKIVFLVRDGRDVAISQYFHQLTWNEKNKLNPKDVNYHRSQLKFKDYNNLSENLLDYLKYIYEAKPSSFKHFTYMGNWDSYNRSWLNQMSNSDNVFMIKYESLLSDPEGSMTSLFENFLDTQIDVIKLQKTIKKFSFEELTNRKKGEEKKDSFLRKGISGDWKNYFGEEEKTIFKQYTTDLLVRLGYEKNMDW